MVEYEGSSANNLLSRHDYFEINSVFADPNGAAAERYKAIGTKTVFYRDGKPNAEMNWDKFGELRAKAGHTGDPTVNAMKLVEQQFGVRRDNVVQGAVSADGLRWRVLDEPLVNVGNSVLDTQNVATYEPETGEYVAYLRGMFHKENEFGYGARRCVRAQDRGQGIRQLVSTPLCPGGGSARSRLRRYLHLLMFPSIYHRLDSEQDVLLAVSRDGWHWVRPERKAIINLESDSGHYSRIRSGPNLVPLNDEEWGLPYDCRYSRHDHGPAELPEGEFRWAVWKRDRLVALEAPIEGKATTIARICQGRELRLNFQTNRAGWIKVEIVTPPTEPNKSIDALEGFSLAEADALSGDELDQVVTWNGKSDLSSLRGKQLALRLHMARGKVFSIAI